MKLKCFVFLISKRERLTMIIAAMVPAEILSICINSWERTERCAGCPKTRFVERKPVLTVICWILQHYAVTVARSQHYNCGYLILIHCNACMITQHPSRRSNNSAKALKSQRQRLSVQSLMSHSTHNRSFRTRVFPGNWLHWCWQPNYNKKEIL